MEANIVKQFIELTECDSKIASLFLERCGMNLNNAVDQWNRIMKCGMEVKKLSRGISLASDNEILVCRARGALASDVDNNKRLSKFGINFLNIPESTFFLPHFGEFNWDFQEFLVKDLIDTNVMKALEDSGKLNWWCATIGYKNRLWPLLTSGDGNCLLHAASLSMFGFHDRLVTLREALYNFISNKNPITESIKRRWRWHESKINLDIGMQSSETEWEEEWLNVVNSASTNKLSGEAYGCYQGLEAIHILCLAHLLRRIIIVIANTIVKDSHDQPLTPIYFHGIYIPFAFDERDCSKNPLLLIYNNSHFSSLVFMEDKPKTPMQSEFCIPIIHHKGDYLPIRFLVDPGADFNWQNFAKSYTYLEEKRSNFQLSLMSSYMEIFDFYDSSFEKESENNVKHDYVDLTNNNVPNQLQNLGKQLLMTKSTTSKKEKVCDNTKRSLLCVKVCITKYAFQNEIIQNYIKFATVRFRCTQKTEQSPENANNLSQDPTDEEFVSCINKCGAYASESTSYLCPICLEQQKKQLQLLGDRTFAAGKSKFYREPDLASYNATKNLPKPDLKSNNTLYLSNSIFFNDSNKPFGHHSNNLQDNIADAAVKDDYLAEKKSENISSIGQEPKNLISESCFGLVPMIGALKLDDSDESLNEEPSKKNSDSDESLNEEPSKKNSVSEIIPTTHIG